MGIKLSLCCRLLILSAHSVRPQKGWEIVAQFSIHDSQKGKYSQNSQAHLVPQRNERNDALFCGRWGWEETTIGHGTMLYGQE